MASTKTAKGAAAKSTEKKKSRKVTKPAASVAAVEAPSANAAPANVNKAKAVRDALGKNPKASPKEISAVLKADGLEITPAYVSLIKWQAKQSKKKSKRSAAAGATVGVVASGVVTDDMITVESLIQAKKLAAALGGVEIARQALTALSRLMG